MTRQEFLDDVTTFDELQDFCSDIDYDLRENGAYSEEEYDDYTNEVMADYARNNGWRDVRDFLDGFPDAGDWFYQDRWGDFEGMSYDDIEEIKDIVYQYAVDNDLFDEDDEEEAEGTEEADEEQPDPDDPEEDDDSDELEECNMDEFIWSGSAALKELRDQSEREEKYTEQALYGILFHPAS